MNIPKHLSHTPIIGVDYETIDLSGDAMYLSLGKATWAKGEDDYSAKVYRLTKEGKWSRQSEELPLWRVLDLAVLLVASIRQSKSYLKEELVGDQKKLEGLNAFLDENKDAYALRLRELKRLMSE